MRYLTDLSPEHQQYWAGLEVSADVELHPDYFRPSFLGEFPERVSVYTAILMEMQTINELSRAMGRVAFFRKDFREGDKPPYFGRLVRPTALEFDQFVLMLDRMLSDNINHDFFGNDVRRQREFERPDGRIEVQQKGSMQKLADWVESKFQPRDQESRDAIAEMLRTLREIRHRRMRPAHALDNNTFRQELARDQRELVKRVYRCLKVIRLMLGNHPQAGAVEIPEPIRDERIWSL